MCLPCVCRVFATCTRICCVFTTCLPRVHVFAACLPPVFAFWSTTCVRHVYMYLQRVCHVFSHPGPCCMFAAYLQRVCHVFPSPIMPKKRRLCLRLIETS